MGFIPEFTPEMGEYSVEVRRESFYLSGAANFVWWRPLKGVPHPAQFSHLTEGEGIEIRDQPSRPRGKGWQCGYVERRHGIWAYQHGDTNQLTVEILLEDIPKIRAALDLVEQTAKG